MANPSSSKLLDLILRQIRVAGPLSVAAYMDLCLAHHEFGYYRRKDPLGVKGDFTTAPEISQLFGEMIGLWVVDAWQRLGSPPSIILCELGPGRGTLMQDISRIIGKLPELKQALSIHLIETSDVLIEKQKVQVPDAIFHASLQSLPTEVPVIFIGNEFLDALPFRQLIKTKDGWHERVIGDQEGKLVFGIGGAVPANNLPEAEEGSIFEFSPFRENVWADICERIKSQKGAALMIDYGYSDPQTLNTFQAVQNHQYANVLENPGEQDLTSHVDFAALARIAGDARIATQADFLKSMGIEVRAQRLATANPDQANDIYGGLHRLIDAEQMGTLFKTISVYTL